MQLPLEAPTGAEYRHGGQVTRDPEPSAWRPSDSEGASGFYQGLAHVYVFLADFAWSDEYWPADGSPPLRAVDEPPVQLVTDDEKRIAAESKGTLDRIDALFVLLDLKNPENPTNGGRRAVQTNPKLQDTRLRMLLMATALRELIRAWVKKQVQDLNIYEVFSPDVADEGLRNDAQFLWDNLSNDMRLQVERKHPDESYEVRGFYRWSRALEHTLRNPSGRDHVTNLEMELAARVLDVFLFQYAEDGRKLFNIRGNKKYSKTADPAPLDNPDPASYVIRVAFRYNRNDKKYEFNLENTVRVRASNVWMKTRNAGMDGKEEADQRKAQLRRRLEAVGGKRLIDMQEEEKLNERQQALGASSLSSSNATEDELVAAARESEKAYKALLAEQKQKRKEKVKNTRFLTELREEEARKKREEERKRDLGILERKRVMSGWNRLARSKELPTANASKPWKWPDLKAAAENSNGTDLELRYREAVERLNAIGRQEDLKGFRKFKQREKEIAEQRIEAERQNKLREDKKAELGILFRDKDWPWVNKRGFRNQYSAYAWKEKDADGNLKYEDRYNQIKARYATAWQYKNENKAWFREVQDGIARDLWVRYHGHQLLPHKNCFPKKTGGYYLDANQQQQRVNGWMRGRMPRPLIPKRGDVDEHEAWNDAEIRTTNQLRCQAHDLMYIDYQVADDPRMAWVTSQMLEDEKARLQLEYEMFMSDERRHLLDVLRACGPGAERPPSGEKGCLEKCYDADKESYALCAPDAPAAMKPKKKSSLLYDYERPCKGEAESLVNGVRMLGGLYDRDISKNALWMESGNTKGGRVRGTEADAKKHVEMVWATEKTLPTGKGKFKKNFKIFTAARNNHLIDVNEGKPCTYGIMPEPGNKDHYYTAMARWIEFDQEVTVLGVYSKKMPDPEDPNDPNKDIDDPRYFAFFQNAEQNPLTKRRPLGTTKPKDLKDGGGSQQADMGLLKILLVEFVHKAETVDPDYNDHKWIGPTHASAFFEKHSGWFRFAKHRVKKGENAPLYEKKKGSDEWFAMVPKTNDQGQTEAIFKPYSVAQHINCFQSDLLQCFPERVDGGGFNDIMDFICWYRTHCWKEWPAGDDAPRDLWDKLCQYACVPALSTWHPGGKKSGEQYYHPRTLNEEILRKLRLLWRGVFFCKKALDFAVSNKDGGALYTYEGLSEEQVEIRKRVLEKWCRLTKGEDCTIPRDAEDALVGDGGDGGDGDGGGGEDMEVDEEQKKKDEIAGKHGQYTWEDLRDMIRAIVRKHDDLNFVTKRMVRHELAKELGQRGVVPETLTRGVWDAVNEMIGEESKLAGVPIQVVAAACRDIVARIDFATEKLKFKDAQALVFNQLVHKGYPVDESEWKEREAAVRNIYEAAGMLRVHRGELAAAIEETEGVMVIAQEFWEKHLNDAQKAQVLALDSAIKESAIPERDRTDGTFPQETKATLDNLKGYIDAVRRMLKAVEAARHAPPPPPPPPPPRKPKPPAPPPHAAKKQTSKTGYEKQGLAQDRARRTGEGARAGDGEITGIVERIVQAQPRSGKLIMIGYWGSSNAPTSAYATTPLFGAIDQWTEIFEAAADHSHLAILMVRGTALPRKRQSPFLELLAEWLPKMHVIALNVGEMNSASPEAVDALETALEHEDCIVGHMFYDSAFISPEQIRRMKNALTRNRHKLGYYQQLVRDEVFQLGGANCWTNFSGRLYARATQRLADEAGYEAEENEATRTRMQLEALAKDKALAEAAIAKKKQK